jgi:hypothetical protein
MKYANIVFIQGEEANEPLELLAGKGEEAVFEYLQQWNYGDAPITESKEPPWGKHDRLFRKDQFVMAYNPTVGYIGLTEIIEQ